MEHMMGGVGRGAWLASLIIGLAGCGTAAASTAPAAPSPSTTTLGPLVATVPPSSPPASAGSLTAAQATAICSQLGGHMVTAEGGVMGAAEGGDYQIMDVGGWASCMFQVNDGDATPANVPASISMDPSLSGEPIGTVWCPHYSGNTAWAGASACLALADS